LWFSRIDEVPSVSGSRSARGDVDGLDHAWSDMDIPGSLSGTVIPASFQGEFLISYRFVGAAVKTAPFVAMA
jgi:hypothetical protein